METTGWDAMDGPGVLDVGQGLEDTIRPDPGYQARHYQDQN
jgi:hypothetical protein